MAIERASSREPFTVVLFGKTGDGKSTVGNMLLSKDAFPAGARMDAITTSMSSEKSDDGEWQVVDTVGLCSPGSDADNTEIANKLYDDLASRITRVDRFCYVRKATKFNKTDEECWKQFDRLFGKYKDNTVLVFTSCKEDWVEQNAHSIERIGLYGSRVGVDFPPHDDDDYIEKEKESTRQRSLESLRIALKTGEAGPVTLKKHGNLLHNICSWTSSAIRNADLNGRPPRTCLPKVRDKSKTPSQSGLSS